MSMSQDWDLDTILQHSRSLKIDDNVAIKKYYDIYRYLKTRPEYKDDDYKTTCDTVRRTMNWLSAYANSDSKSSPKKDENKANH
jgi:hypothetical protein